METLPEPEQPKELGGENPVVTNRESRIVHLKRRIIEVYDWVLGPASTERERSQRAMAELRNNQNSEYLGV